MRGVRHDRLRSSSDPVASTPRDGVALVQMGSLGRRDLPHYRRHLLVNRSRAQLVGVVSWCQRLTRGDRIVEQYERGNSGATSNSHGRRPIFYRVGDRTLARRSNNNSPARACRACSKHVVNRCLTRRQMAEVLQRGPASWPSTSASRYTFSGAKSITRFFTNHPVPASPRKSPAAPA
jgi:hypothetical protein